MRDRRSDGNYNRRIQREDEDSCSGRIEERITAEAEIVVSLGAAGFGYQSLGRGHDNALLTLSETKNREYMSTARICLARLALNVTN